jgi:ParB-like chromosome segregation protein Spo0J
MLKQQFEIHPAATLFPMMTEEEYQGLKKDIEENGQREDIVVWCGKLIDGRNRLRACQELQRQPQISELDYDQDPWKYVISHNLHRRHLTTTQRAAVADKLANLKHGGDRKSVQETNLSLEDAAKQLKVSVGSVKSARKVREQGSEAVKQAVEQGAITVSAAAELVKQVPDKKEQTRIVKSGPQEVRKAVKEVEQRSKPDREQEDSKVEEFKKFWARCSQVSRIAIRVWINEQF